MHGLLVQLVQRGAGERGDDEEQRFMQVAAQREVDRAAGLLERLGRESEHEEAAHVHSLADRDPNVLLDLVHLEVLLDQLLEPRAGALDGGAEKERAGAAQRLDLPFVEHVGAQRVRKMQRRIELRRDDPIEDVHHPGAIEIEDVVDDFEVVDPPLALQLLHLLQDILRRAGAELLSLDLVAVDALERDNRAR